MLRTYIRAMVLMAFSCSITLATDKFERWRVDKSEVFVGGAVSVIIDGRGRDASALKLKIDDRPAIPLMSAGESQSHGGETAILLSHSIHFPEVVQMVDGAAAVVHVPPIFAQPGEVKLTIESPDGSTRSTRTVTVVDAPPDAREANDLLYPNLEGVRSPRTGDHDVFDPASLTWMQLLLTDSFGLTPPITHEQMQQLREELPIIMKHPDWAEIAEMRVARLEAYLHRQSITFIKDGNRFLRDDVTELPPLPGIVDRCLKARPRNPYVRAIQDNMRGTVRELRFMDAQRKGEDVQGLLREWSMKRED